MEKEFLCGFPYLGKIKIELNFYTLTENLEVIPVDRFNKNRFINKS